jgi:hypothetical protein
LTGKFPVHNKHSESKLLRPNRPIERLGRKEGRKAQLLTWILNGQVGGQAPPTSGGTIEKIEMAHNFFDICRTDMEELRHTFFLFF